MLPHGPPSLDGQIQRASIPITGEALCCTPYDEAQSVEFGDVVQLETNLGDNYWQGYVEVDFGMRFEPRMDANEREF